MKIPKELIKFKNIKKFDIIQKHCLYFLYDFEELVYIGKSDKSISMRMFYHLKDKYFTDAYYIEFSNKDFCLKKEKELISKFQPKYNLKGTNNKENVIKLIRPEPQKKNQSIKFNADNLKNILKKKDISYKSLAEKIGISYHIINNAIANQTAPLNTLNKIDEVLNLNPRDLLI